MARMTKLAYESHKKMESMKAMGISKHSLSDDEKKDKIFSYNTYSSYQQTSKEFCSWWNDTFGAGKKGYDDVEKEHIIMYLKQRQEKGLSAWTISKDMSALNKIFQTDVTKKQAQLQKRSYKDITRSRHEDPFRNAPKNAEEKYHEQIIIAKAFGLRRNAITKIQKNQFLRDRNGKIIKLDITGNQAKGGRLRVINIRQDMQEQVQKLVDQKGEGQLFDSYHKEIDNYTFRREFAQTRYKEELEKLDTTKTDYRGEYDSRALTEVTEDLGHGRLDVVVYNYLK